MQSILPKHGAVGAVVPAFTQEKTYSYIPTQPFFDSGDPAATSEMTVTCTVALMES
jgi:hypothetical protein